MYYAYFKAPHLYFWTLTTRFHMKGFDKQERGDLMTKHILLHFLHFYGLCTRGLNFNILQYLKSQAVTKVTIYLPLSLLMLLKRAHSSLALVLVTKVTSTWALMPSGHCLSTQTTTQKCKWTPGKSCLNSIMLLLPKEWHQLSIPVLI